MKMNALFSLLLSHVEVVASASLVIYFSLFVKFPS